MTFLSIGLETIIPELFQDIKNNPKNPFKPIGGLWATKHIEEIPYYNPWLDAICENKRILTQYIQKNKFNQNGILLTIKNQSNIFILDSLEKFTYLMENFSINENIDYEKLAQVYDGFYINIEQLYGIENPIIKKLIQEYIVSTFILFNLNRVLCYKKANINIEEFDLSEHNYLPFYSINVNPGVEYIRPKNPKCEALIEIMREYVFKNNLEINAETIELLRTIYLQEIKNTYGKDDLETKEELILRKTFYGI